MPCYRSHAGAHSFQVLRSWKHEMSRKFQNGRTSQCSWVRHSIGRCDALADCLGAPYACRAPRAGHHRRTDLVVSASDESATVTPHIKVFVSARRVRAALAASTRRDPKGANCCGFSPRCASPEGWLNLPLSKSRTSCQTSAAESVRQS